MNATLAIIQICIEKEFIKASYFEVCLPESLIFFELAERYGLQTQVRVGARIYENGLTISPHFWNENSGIIYDPTINITKHYINHDFPARFEADMVTIQRPEDQLMRDSLFQQNSATEEYFSKAPVPLLKIRKCIHKRVANKANKK